MLTKLSRWWKAHRTEAVIAVAFVALATAFLWAITTHIYSMVRTGGL